MTQPKPSYVSDRENPANDRPLSLALRQLQRVLSGPVFWIIVGAAVLITAMAGPYHTLARLNIAERLVYWGTTVTLSAVLMTFLSIYAFCVTETSRWNWAVVAALAGIVGVPPVLGTTYLAEGLATGFAAGWSEGPGIFPLLLSVAPPLIAVTLVVSALIRYQNGGDDPQASKAALPHAGKLTLLQTKLPHHLGHDIIAVQAQDHYVEVTTPQGSALILMRLGDAVRDLAPLGGLQVHRSWWVNLAHVTRMEKGPSGPELLLSSDQRIPVGRSFRAALKQANLS